MAAPDTPTFSYGLRGLAGAEIIVKGPSADLHSGVFGGAVANPIAALAEIIASFHDEEGRVAVRGFLRRRGTYRHMGTQHVGHGSRHEQ